MAGDTKQFQEAVKRGSTHAWNGRWEKAAEEYRLALEHSPDDLSARTCLAMALYRSGQLEAALELYGALWKAQPSNLSILQRVAELEDALGRRESAAANYRVLSEILGRRRSAKEALKAWRKVVELEPGDPLLWGSLMDAAAQAGAVADVMPAYLGLARELALAGRFGEAIEVAERAQRLDVANPSVMPLLTGLRRALQYSWHASSLGEQVLPEDLVRFIPPLQPAGAVVLQPEPPVPPALPLKMAEPAVPAKRPEPSLSADAPEAVAASQVPTPEEPATGPPPEGDAPAETPSVGLERFGSSLALPPRATLEPGLSTTAVDRPAEVEKPRGSESPEPTSKPVGEGRLPGPIPVAEESTPRGEDELPPVGTEAGAPERGSLLAVEEDAGQPGEVWTQQRPAPSWEAADEPAPSRVVPWERVEEWIASPRDESPPQPPADEEELPLEPDAVVAEEFGEAEVPAEEWQAAPVRPELASKRDTGEKAEGTEQGEASGIGHPTPGDEDQPRAASQKAQELEVPSQHPALGTQHSTESSVPELAEIELSEEVVPEVLGPEVAGALEAVEASGLTWDELLRRAQEARSSGQLEEAVALFEESLAGGTAIAQQFADLAATHEQLGRREQAAAAFQQALELDPDLPEALLGMARVHLSDRRLNEAERKARRVLEVSPREGDGANAMAAEMLLGILRERTAYGDMGAAAEGLTWLRFGDVAGRLPDGWVERIAQAVPELLGRCAGEHLEEVSLLPPETRGVAVLALRRAEGWLATGRGRAAADEMYRLIGANPDFLPAHSMLGRILVAQGRRDEARERSRRLLLLYEMRGTPGHALEILWWTVAQGIANGEARDQLVALLQAQNRGREAELAASGQLEPLQQTAWIPIPEAVSSPAEAAALPSPGGAAEPGEGLREPAEGSALEMGTQPEQELPAMRGLEEVSGAQPAEMAVGEESSVDVALRLAESRFALGDRAGAVNSLRSVLDAEGVVDPINRVALLRLLQLLGCGEEVRDGLADTMRRLGLPEELAD